MDSGELSVLIGHSQKVQKDWHLKVVKITHTSVVITLVHLNKYDQNRNKYQFVKLLKNDLDQLVHNGWVENQGHDVAKYP